MDAKAIVNSYFRAFYSGDFEAAKNRLCEQFRFKGPFVETADRDAFFKSAEPLGRIVQGHTLLAQWQDEATVCSIYDLHLKSPAGSGSVTFCEWHTLEGNHITSARVLFDTAAFRELLPKTK